MQFTEPNYRHWMERLEDICSVERVMNHIHVYDVFETSTPQSEEDFEVAANIIKRSWEISLSLQFPRENFEVILYNADNDYGPTVTFFRSGCSSG